MPLISERPDMKWITRSFRGGEVGAASCDAVLPFVTVVTVEVPPKTRTLISSSLEMERCEMSGHVDATIPSSFSIGRF
ncbi:hypothetical protein F2Q68_00005095 [Brassica cretica]|uniref:Uncharacterized protein n=1 Tax=Brassica cretica TaxID=69181 RepID=A0A8S9JAR2_BRACR|nr:hypothetical protein F2Q68_00005095 [Brassica cretica]